MIAAENDVSSIFVTYYGNKIKMSIFRLSLVLFRGQTMRGLFGCRSQTLQFGIKLLNKGRFPPRRKNKARVWRVSPLLRRIKGWWVRLVHKNLKGVNTTRKHKTLEDKAALPLRIKHNQNTNSNCYK